jgi:hypothetical protein
MAYGMSVLEAARAAKFGNQSMWQDGDGKFPQQDLITIKPDGAQTTHTMNEIEYGDLRMFFTEFDQALKLQSPIVQSILAKNCGKIAQLIRVTNKYTNSGFKGSGGFGNQLDCVLARAEQFQSPDAAGILARTTFARIIGAAGTLQYICQPDALGANLHGALSLTGTPAGTNNDAFALFGFMNTAAFPCTSAFQVTYLGVTYNIQNLGFEMTNNEFGESVIEMKQPLIVYPGENALISVRYFQAGTDELRPIGVWVKTATNLRALATS